MKSDHVRETWAMIGFGLMSEEVKRGFIGQSKATYLASRGTFEGEARYRIGVSNEAD
ncbi:hypothetical protein CCHR01_16709 [Colletotrichum chrysophilum]|uniref:Uncharacterized protein n=1 Tax=Colletotrichum chrysophilum TaxID=1836956 RepID=A0AAD9A3E0_9PEZI|nr:hypothetical protein K456DRAFT_1044509 [Colletotrichum gloeosporioides 23]KAK1840668.1 hypothetical protein CCHR01_16709 [Colletotrichum chrysophilum]